MADITPHRIGELLRIIFELLWYHPEGLPARDILVHVQKAAPPTEYESGYPLSTPGISRFETIIRLATASLVRVGWLIKNNKGRWYITDEGRQACKQFADAGEFYKESVRLYNEYSERKRGRPTTFLALEEAKEKSWEQIREYLLGLKPFEFKIMVGELLRALGYYVVWITPPEKDRGLIDIVACSDPLRVSRPRLIVQVKHKGQAATVEGLMAFLSILSPNDIGLFISSGGFTTEAREEALPQNGRTFALIDLESFFDLWVKHYEQLALEGRLRLPLESVNFLSSLE